MTFFKLIDNYLISRLTKRSSTALFWYLPEPANIKTLADLQHYQNRSSQSPFYLMDYRQKLNYSLTNAQGIIVLPYDAPIGHQVNPEAAFQYALGLHDAFYFTGDKRYLDNFFHYANYFVKTQSHDGLWHYHFDWFDAKAPWSSALAQGRGASVMLRAWLLSKKEFYRDAALNAVKQFNVSIEKGGFLHLFSPENCYYFEEYPTIPTGTINGFMATLMNIWELQYWIKEKELTDFWVQGIHSLEKMLPYYSTGWWSLYDRDDKSPILNVNSPRYHFLEMQYLQVLGVISDSRIIFSEYKNRCRQYFNRWSRKRALGQKLVRKIIYK